VTFSDPAPEVTKAQVDRVLEEVQAQAAALETLERELGKSKEYLLKVGFFIVFLYLILVAHASEHRPSRVKKILPGSHRQRKSCMPWVVPLQERGPNRRAFLHDSFCNTPVLFFMIAFHSPQKNHCISPTLKLRF
jgi:hypothetical protein